MSIDRHSLDAILIGHTRIEMIVKMERSRWVQKNIKTELIDFAT